MDYKINGNEKANIANYTKILDNSNDEQVLKVKSQPLDPNHSHFILVDNQELNKFGGEIELRGNLEKAISHYNIGKQEKIPIVVLVIGKTISIE